MSKTKTTINIDDNLKSQAAPILEQLGFNFTSLYDMLLRQVVRNSAVILPASVKDADAE